VKKVTIVDYGLGNLHSVTNVLAHLGAEVAVATDAAGLAAAGHIILPGVGAFGDGMAGLRARGQDEALREHVSRGRPLLGICLGAQLLFTESDEFGQTRGLDLIPGRVTKIPSQDVKVPLVGWRRLRILDFPANRLQVLTPSMQGAWMYFVHGYHCIPTHAEHLLAVVSHGPHQVHAAVARDATCGLQFHPEKSGRDGMEILTRFLAS
jgi:glutamine amidotransferase